MSRNDGVVGYSFGCSHHASKRRGFRFLFLAQDSMKGYHNRVPLKCAIIGF